MFIKILVITNTNSIFSFIAGFIKHLQQRGCWWYQVSLINFPLTYMSRRYTLICSDNRNFCVMIIYLNKPLDTHDCMVGLSWSILSMFAPIFYGVLVVLSGGVVNPIFWISLMIFVEILPRYFCDVLDFIPTGIN